MKNSSCVPPGSAGWNAASAGGSANINQPWPASTDLRPKISLKNARSAAASLLYSTIWAPTIISFSLNGLPNSTGNSKGCDKRLTGPCARLYCAPSHLKRVFRDLPAIDGVQKRVILGSSPETFVVLGYS